MKNKSLEEIQKSIQEFKKKNLANLSNLSQLADRVTHACSVVERSWSRSFAGYHGSLYYGDFETPPVDRQFSIEWGGIHGIPDGWRKRSPEEVLAEIEKLVGQGFSIKKLEDMIKELRKNAEELRTEIVIYFSPFSFGKNMEKEKELLSQIDNFKFGERKEVYIQKNLPKSMMTRDSDAIMQGICVVPHLFYEGVAYEGESTCNAVEKFLKLSERLVRQAHMKRLAKGQIGQRNGIETLSNIHPKIYAKCHRLYEKGLYVEAVEKSFKVVRDRLRELTGYETGSEAFGKGRLHIKGAAAPNVDQDFNQGVKFLTMAIDRFRNEKSHTSDAEINDPIRAREYLSLSSLAMKLLDNAEIIS